MSHTFTLTHAKVVTPDAVLEDTNVVVSDGVIESIDSNSKGNEINLQGNYLLPGLVDLHCDAIEKEIEPRAGVIIPYEVALRQVDTRNLVAGITTIYHCLSFAGDELGVRNPQLASEIVNTLTSLRPHLTVKNKVHARFEVSQLACESIVTKLIENGEVDMLSFMDHGQGQGQFLTMEEYRDFLVRNYALEPEEAERRIKAKASMRHKVEQAIENLTQLSKAHNIPMLSHDDDSIEMVNVWHQRGVVASEFPLNEPTARHARELGINTLAGAPNVLRGKSQGNGMSALAAVEADVINVLTSDYLPNSLLPAAFKVHDKLDMDLAKAIALISSNPASIDTTQKIGRIETGCIADLIAVQHIADLPVVSQVWIDGKNVLSRKL